MSKVSKRMRDTVSSHQQDVMDASLSQREDGQGKTEEASTSSLNINNYEDKDGDDDGNTGLLITETIVCFQKAFYQKAKEALRRIFKLEWRKIWHLEHYAVSSMTVINNVKITTLLCCSGFSFNEGLVLMRPMDSNPAFVLLNLLAIIAFELHELVIAKSFFEHLEEIIDENDHQWKNELIAVKCNMGCFFINCGQYDRTLRYFEKAAEISKEQLFYLAGIRNNVGQTYQVIGNYGEAERCFKDTLNILQHDEDSMNKTILLATKHNLARLYKQQERPDHALLELRQALNLCKEDHAVPRPFQGVLAAELLSLSLSQGERKENVPLQKYCVDLQSNIMSRDGGSIVDKADVAFLEAYAKVFLQRGEITAAKTMLYDFYLLFQNFHGQDHPYLIPLLYQLGYAYFTKNNYKQCAELMEKTENVAAETFGASNPKLLPIYSKLAELQFYHFKKEDLAKQYFEKVMKVLSCIKENGGSLLEKHLDHLKNIGILGSCVSLAVSDNYLILNLSRETLFKERRLHATKYNNAFEYCQKSEKQPIELFFRFGDSCVLMKNLTTLVNSLNKLDKNGVAVAALKSRLHHHQQPRQQQQKSLFVNHLKNKEILQVYQMISGLLKPRQSEHTGDYHCFDSLGKMIYYSSADIFARNRTVSCDVLVMEENPNSVAQDHSKAAKQNISVVVVEGDCVQPKFNVIASSVKPVDINDLRKLKDRSFECIKQTLEIAESSQQGRFVVAVNQTVESESVQALCDDLGILPLLVHELIKPDASFEGAKIIQKLPSKSAVQIQGKFPGVFLHKLLITCFNEKELLGEVCDFVESKKTVSFLSIKPRKTHISVSCKQGFIEIVINSLCSQASDESVCDCALNVIHITNIVEKCAHSFGIQLEQRYSQTSCRQTGECYLQQRRAGVLYHDTVAQETDVAMSSTRERQGSEDGRISEAERPGIGRNLSPVEDVREFEKRPSIGRGADSKIGKKNTETKSTNKSSDSDSSGDFGEDESACNTRYTLRQITDRDSLIDKSLKTSNDWKRNDVVSKANKSPGLWRHTAPDSDHQENQEFNNSEAETHGYRISFIKDETDEQTDSGLGALPGMSDYCTRNKPDQKLQTSFGEDVALSSDNHSCLKLVSFDTEGQSIEAELEIQNTGSRSECTGRDDESNLLSQSHRRESTDFTKMDTPLNKEDYSENDATDRVPVAAATHILPHGTSLPVGTALTNIKSTETLTTFKDFEDNQSVEQNQATKELMQKQEPLL